MDALHSTTDSIGSPFTFDFGRSSLRPKRPFLRDMRGSAKLGRSADSAPSVEPPVETQLLLQSQQEELGRLQQEQAQLREELASQKVCYTGTLVVCLFMCFYPCAWISLVLFFLSFATDCAPLFPLMGISHLIPHTVVSCSCCSTQSL